MDMNANAGRFGRQGGTVCDATPVIGAAVAFVSGDQLGTVMELKSAIAHTDGCAVLDSLTVVDLDAQSGVIDVLIFDQLPVPNSVDNGALDLTAADAGKILGVISIAAADYKVVKSGVSSVASEKNLNFECMNKTPASSTNPDSANRTSLWALAVSRDTKTYTAGLKFRFGFR